MAEKAHVTKTTEAKKENPASRMQKAEYSPPTGSPIECVLYLQRTVGNQAVQRLMKSGALLAKLRLGAPGDVYEQEADRVAEQVMGMPGPGVSGKISDNPVQRAYPKCIDRRRGEDEEALQSKEISGSTPETTPELEANISTVRDGGQPLPESVRAFFEPRFGHDFSGVRMHTDARAAEAARAVDARAFTVGRDMVFGEGEYAPDANEGRRLMAHELTHIIQQSRYLATTTHGGHAHEFEADKASNTISSNTSQFQIHLVAQVGIAREPAPIPPVSETVEGLLPAGGTPAMTPEDMYNKLVNRYFDEHIPVHQMREVEKQLEEIKRQLESMEAQFKKTPTDELKNGLKTLKSDYKRLQNRIYISQFEGPGAIAGHGYDTHVIIQIIDKDGNVVKDTNGNDLVAYGKNVGQKHAEQIAIEQLEKQLGERKVLGARVVVVGDKEVCPEICEPALQKFAADHKFDSVVGHVFEGSKLKGKGKVTEKTVATAATKASSEGRELYKKTKTIYNKPSNSPGESNSGSPAIKGKTASPIEKAPEIKPDTGSEVIHEPKTPLSKSKVEPQVPKTGTPITPKSEPVPGAAQGSQLTPKTPVVPPKVDAPSAVEPAVAEPAIKPATSEISSTPNAPTAPPAKGTASTASTAAAAPQPSQLSVTKLESVGGKGRFYTGKLGTGVAVGGGILIGILEAMARAKIETENAEIASATLKANIESELSGIDKRIIAAIQLNNPGKKIYAHITYTILEKQGIGPGDPYTGDVIEPARKSVESVEVTAINSTYTDETTQHRYSCKHWLQLFSICDYTIVSISVELPMLSAEELKKYVP